MSTFLYKLGSFAARKAWVVIGIWALILAGLGGAYGAFRGELTNEITIPGTEAQQLQETLTEKFDTNAAAGMGQVILETEDGSEFTADQKKAVASAVSTAEGVGQVDSVMDPFATSAQLEDGRTQLEDGQKKLDDAKKQLDDTQRKIDDGSLESDARKQMDDAQKKLDEGKQQVEQADQAKKDLDDAQKELDRNRDELERNERELNQAQRDLDQRRAQAQAAGGEALAQFNAAQGELDANRAQLEAGKQQLEDGQRQIDSGRDELKKNEKQIEDARKQVEEGQKELDAQRKSLDDGSLVADAQKQVDDGRAEVEKNQKELDQNRSLMDMSSDAAAISDDGSAAIAAVTFNDEIMKVTPASLEETRDAFAPLEDEGIKVLYDQNLEGQTPELKATAEIIGIIVALIILFVMMGTFIAAGLPILMAVIGLGAAMLGTLALSSVVDMTSTTPALGSMLGLAVGIDYTLFILNRHRNNLARGMEMKKSIALATGTSGGAVVFAGTTVIIALLALNVVGIPFLSVMGNAAAFAVFMAVLVSVTLSPAILSLVGRRIISKKRWEAIDRRHASSQSTDPEIAAEARAAAAEKENRPGKWLGAVLSKPLVTVFATVAALVILALPMLDMRLGLPDGSSQPEDSAQYQTYRAIEENFGAGQNGQVIVAANLPEGMDEAKAKELQVEVGEQLQDVDSVEKVIPAMISKDNDMLLYQIVPSEGPSAESTEALVNNLRDTTTSTDYGDVTYGVTGQAAMNIDISENLFRVLPIYIAIVVGLSLLVLILVFRSIWVPVTATLGFLFSLMAAFGITTAVFQWGWMGSLFGVTTPGPILSFLPILAVGILFGLAMDYQVFLVSAMREAYAHGKPAKDAVVVGFNHSSRVVVAAALIMAGVFLGFVFSGDPMIASIGFVLAFGVLADAFIVRMMLIPALMRLLGEKAWTLPRWLDKLLPDLDIEGTKLEHEVVEEPRETSQEASVEAGREPAQEQPGPAHMAEEGHHGSQRAEATSAEPEHKPRHRGPTLSDVE